MLIIVAIILLLVLPSPWGAIAFVVTTALWIVELFAWNRTVKNRRRVVGAETLIGRTAVVEHAVLSRGPGAPRRRDLGRPLRGGRESR